MPKKKSKKVKKNGKGVGGKGVGGKADVHAHEHLLSHQQLFHFFLIFF